MRHLRVENELRKTSYDLLAIALIVIAYLVVVLLMPIARDFALLDDWAYMRAAEKILSGSGPAPIQFAQATYVTQGYWGALFLSLFGISFTAATASTMVLSLIAAVSFYVLLRQLGLMPGMSGLGTAVLALNPYYLYLSYTFMTEIPFVAIMLLTCICYLRGMKTGIDEWLWVGGIFAALTFLTRQFGIALPVAALLWLFWARKLTPAKAMAVALVPLAATVGYQLWSSGFGTTFSGSVSREEILDLFRSPVEWLHRAAHFVFFALFLPGLTIPLWGKIRRGRIALLLAALTVITVYLLWKAKLGLVTSSQGSLNELSFTWLQRNFPDPTWVYCIGSALTILLLFGVAESGWPATLSFMRRGETPPAGFFYLAGALLFVGTYLVSAGFLDRYWVPLLPFLIAAALAALKAARPAPGVPRFMRVTVPIILTLTALFGFAIHLDDYAYQSASWQAGRSLLVQGVPLEKIENGYSWDGYYLYDESLKLYPNSDVNIVGRTFPPAKLIDPQYVISTRSQPGYSVARKFPFFSILGGMRNQDMLVLKRN